MKESNILLKNDCNKEIVYETEKLKKDLDNKYYLWRKKRNDYDFDKQ